MFVSVDPSTGEEIARYDRHDDAEVTRRLARAWDAFGDWRATSFAERAAVLTKAADLLDAQADDIADLMTSEMGKPITAARSEAAKCAWACRHYAEHGQRYLEHDVVETDARTSYVRFDPLGPILAVMPWNFPFWQAFRALVPALTAGNTMLLKHASNVPGCALRIEEVLAEAGVPDGVFSTLMIGGSDVADVIADDRVRGVTVTGSVATGRAVAEAAGRHLKPSVLELGGSDAFVVLPDADLARAAEVGATSRLINNGESCIAAKRFVVVEEVATNFLDAFRDHLADATVGDPKDPDTDVGPLAREDLRDDLHDQVRRSVDEGATLLLGGEPLDRPGFFYAPTLLSDVEADMTAATEETFGPAAAVIVVPDEESAIAVANSSSFGLGASVWTQDRDRGQRVAAELEAGGLFVNQLVKSDPRMPFGGVKDSGYGRELGAYGIREFVNAKTVWVE